MTAYSINLHLLTVDEAAERAGVHRQTITRAADLGKLPEVRTAGHLRQRLYFTHDVDRWNADRSPDLRTRAQLRAKQQEQYHHDDGANTHDLRKSG